ncbi:MAG: hypothetical protein R2747_20270 [Pyrinomonadaceae bacterium]
MFKKITNPANFAITSILVLTIALGCGGFRNPLRSYDSKPFDAELWRKGDLIERGQMAKDLVGFQPVQNKAGVNRRELIENLGQPDLILEDSIGDRKATVLVYQIDLGTSEFDDALRIYVDENDRTVFANLSVIREKKKLFDF